MERHLRKRVGTSAFTLVEVLMAMLVLGIAIGGIVFGFLQSLRQAEWSAYSLAAQALATQPVEQARGAKWDPYANPPIDQITNLPGDQSYQGGIWTFRTNNILDIPISGTNIVYATNTTTIRKIGRAHV